MTNQIPSPTHKTNKEKYKFSQYNVGDSEFYQAAATKVSAAVCMFVKRNKPNWKFRTSVEPAGVRVWRVK